MKKILSIVVFSLLILSLFTPSAIALGRTDIIQESIAYQHTPFTASFFDTYTSYSVLDGFQLTHPGFPLSGLHGSVQYDNPLDLINYHHPSINTLIFDDVTARKPNIYLYSDQDLCAHVRLAPERAITVSEPAYQPGIGWQAEICSGSLNGAGDFLFYEAMVPDSVWQNEEGYIIHATDREQDMASMLGQYGFNEKECTDFIDYWDEYLSDDIDYVFYPQETDAVNEVMPLFITPTPDEVFRLWFYAGPFETVPEPVTDPEKIVRDGFHVVEWGVMIQDK